MSPIVPTTGRREFEFTLPIGYTDDDGTVHRTVALRKMTGREEAILADRRYQRNGGKLVTELLHSCLVRLGRPAGERPVHDRGDVLGRPQLPAAQAARITFGSELPASYTCPAATSQ